MKNLTVEWICALWEQTKITRFLQFVEAGSQEKPEAQGISVKKKKKKSGTMSISNSAKTICIACIWFE